MVTMHSPWVLSGRDFLQGGCFLFQHGQVWKQDFDLVGIAKCPKGESVGAMLGSVHKEECGGVGYLLQPSIDTPTLAEMCARGRL